jgi:hypothetical protein
MVIDADLATAAAVFPRANASYEPLAGEVGVRFLLGDPLALTDLSKKFGSQVYDDSQPYDGTAPHPPIVVPATIPGIVAAGEIDITNMTWARNTYIHVQSLDSATLANISDVSLTGAFFLRDTATSGLGLNSQLPVLVLPMTFTTPGAPMRVRIVIEIRHTLPR